jgi:hypothetical protein
MKYAKYILLAALLITTIAIAACDQKTNQEDTGNNSQELQCDLTEGETYCESENKCMQVWNEYCEEYSEYYKEPGVCTREYVPVTGDITFPCDSGLCTTKITFSNKCVAENAGAKNIKLVHENDETQVTNFNECVEAGNPIMESYPRSCIHKGEVFKEEITFEDMTLSNDKYEACQELGGNPLAEYGECEHISESACEYLGGTFNECESACRNDPDAEMCTLQCVIVCDFN